MTSCFSCGSMWMSDARTCSASSNTVCSSRTTGASACAFAQRLQADDAGLALAHLAREFLGQAGDLLGAPVDAVDGRQQVAFRDHGELDVALDQPGDLVVGEQVGRIGHADENAAVPPLQQHGAEAPRLRFRQQLQNGRLRVEFPEVDERQIHLPRQRLGDVVFARQPAFDDDAAEPAAALLLRGQRNVQVGAGNDFLLDEQVAQANFLACRLRGCRGRGGLGLHVYRIGSKV